MLERKLNKINHIYDTIKSNKRLRLALKYINDIRRDLREYDLGGYDIPFPEIIVTLSKNDTITDEERVRHIMRDFNKISRLEFEYFQLAYDQWSNTDLPEYLRSQERKREKEAELQKKIDAEYKKHFGKICPVCETEIRGQYCHGCGREFVKLSKEMDSGPLSFTDRIQQYRDALIESQTKLEALQTKYDTMSGLSKKLYDEVTRHKKSIKYYKKLVREMKG